MHASIRQVSSAHSGREKWLRRSEISSSGEVEFCVETTSLGGVVLAAAVLTLAAAFFLDFQAFRLVAAVDLVSGFLGMTFLVAVTIGCSGASVTG